MQSRTPDGPLPQLNFGERLDLLQKSALSDGRGALESLGDPQTQGREARWQACLTMAGFWTNPRLAVSWKDPEGAVQTAQLLVPFPALGVMEPRREIASH